MKIYGGSHEEKLELLIIITCLIIKISSQENHIFENYVINIKKDQNSSISSLNLNISENKVLNKCDNILEILISNNTFSKENKHESYILNLINNIKTKSVDYLLQCLRKNYLTNENLNELDLYLKNYINNYIKKNVLSEMNKNSIKNGLSNNLSYLNIFVPNFFYKE